MSPATRLALGSLVGVVVVAFLHPLTRPFLLPVSRPTLVESPVDRRENARYLAGGFEGRARGERWSEPVPLPSPDFRPVSEGLLAAVARPVSDAAPRLVSEARVRLARAGFERRDDVRLRRALVRLGGLVRDGARRNVTGRAGATLVEIAVFPPGLARYGRPKRLMLGRTKLIEGMRANGRAAEIPALWREFRANDAWTGLVDPGTDRVLPERASWIALRNDAARVALLLAVAAAVATGGWAIVPAARARLVAASLLVAGAAGLAYRGEVVAAFAVALTVVALVVARKPERTRETDNPLPRVLGAALGPLATVGIVASGGTRLAARRFASASDWSLPVAFEPLGKLGAIAGLATALGLLLCLLAATQARFSISRTVREFGLRFGIAVGLSAVALAAGLAVIAAATERGAVESLRALLLNEPVYHVTRAG